MRRQFVFKLGQTGGEYFVTSEGGKDVPGFFFVKRTRSDAITAATTGIGNWLRTVKGTAPKGAFAVEKTERYVKPVVEGAPPPRPKKFGGLPIKEVTPNEVITVGVEV